MDSVAITFALFGSLRGSN